VHHINWNEGGYCPFGRPLFWYLPDVNLGKIRKPNFGANFLKTVSFVMGKVNGRSGLVSPSRKCN
jgi:hypothetical protein